MSTHTSNVNQEELQRLAELVKRPAVVHGKTTLSSGREADYYVDLRRAILHHESSRLIGSLLRKLTADWDYVHVGGLTLNTDPMATPVIHAEGRPINAFMVHKGAKEHSMQYHVEGPDIVNKRILVVEDTTTTGSSPLTAVTVLHEADTKVIGVATVVDHAVGADEVIKAEGLECRYLLSLDGLGLA